ncbi:MAG TPA: hypothetical protein VGL02_31825, partial [Streptomyces sp.]
AGFRRTALGVVAFSALLTACSGGSGSAQPGDPPSSTASAAAQSPTPAPTTPTATGTPAPDPSLAAEFVREWFDNGGEPQMRQVSADTAKIQKYHEIHSSIIDFTQFFSDINSAKQYAPIPDRACQSLWSTALKDLADGGDDVYQSAPLGSGTSPGAAQRKGEAKGWKEFDAGVTSLKAAEARLHKSFGLDLHSNPWDWTP